jgi:pimeloyl-ACP methyl ester carboxylesterase
MRDVHVVYLGPMEFALSTGQTLVADRYGASSAPLVVLLHGLSSNRLTYDSLLDHLGARIDAGTLQVVNVDMRGHGQASRSTLDGYQASHYAQDVAALIESLTHDGAIVIGHSLGGLVAASLATSHPGVVRALFLEDPPLFEGDAARRAASPVAAFFPMLVAAVRALHDRSAPLADYEALALTHSAPEEVVERGYSLSVWDPTTMQAAVDGIVWHGFDPTAAIACPMTILRADPTVGAVFEPHDAPRVMASNPHAHVHLVEGASHSIRTTQPAAYFAHLDHFLDSVL